MKNPRVIVVLSVVALLLLFAVARGDRGGTVWRWLASFHGRP